MLYSECQEKEGIWVFLIDTFLLTGKYDLIWKYIWMKDIKVKISKIEKKKKKKKC